MTAKQRVLRVLPNAYCVRMKGWGEYLVWPGKIQGRGFERPACGWGKTARQAWASVKLKGGKR